MNPSGDAAPNGAFKRMLLSLRALHRLRRAFLVFYYQNTLGSVGRNFRLGLRSVIVEPSKVRIGDNFFAGPGTYISSHLGVFIGDNVMFGPEVMILGGDHNFSAVGVPMRSSPPREDGEASRPIIIEDDVWVGARVIILKGVRIETGSVIGAGSVVTRSIPPFSVAVGSPCRVIRSRFSSEGLREHKRLLGAEEAEVD